uniref:Uroplakin 3B n=1 Tax=Terrapene triunguis TaxID=2587831 RepID=A0A674I6N0_9SAUR
SPLPWARHLAASLCAFVSPETVPYTPQITAKSLEGKLTATTFTLDQPICIFDQYVNSTDDIWLVVAFTNVTSHFKNPTSKIQIPPYQKLSTALHYMTLKTSIAFYPCAENRPPSVLRVGSDTSCKDDRSLEYCNGPLPHPGPYRYDSLSPGSPADRGLAALSLTQRKSRVTPGQAPLGTAVLNHGPAVQGAVHTQDRQMVPAPRRFLITNSTSLMLTPLVPPFPPSLAFCLLRSVQHPRQSSHHQSLLFPSLELTRAQNPARAFAKEAPGSF